MYIRNYNEIRIVAKAWDSTKVKLDFAVKQNDGKYYYVNRWEELSAIVGIARKNIIANMKKLQEAGLLIRHGADKNGWWEVTES